MKRRNLVAKHARTFNRASVVPDKTKTYKRQKRVNLGDF